MRNSIRLLVASTLLTPALVACGSSGGTPKLTWYINPDNGGQVRLAQKCAAQSGGKFRIATSILPNDATSQREQLVRRLAAKDSSIDLMSLDPPFVAEFANAGFLRPFSAEEAKGFTDGVLQAPITNATWKDQLVAAPFWANTQLLWYRKSVAKEAGVDPTAATFTWDQMIKAAVQTRRTVGEQGSKYEGYMVWINALVASAGGSILDDPQAGADAKAAIDSPAGKDAAVVIRDLSRSRAASPTLGTDTEEQARALFQSGRGGFMLNWPYVYGAAQAAVKSGDLPKSVVEDIAWARYPRVRADLPSKPPFGGIELAIGNYGKYKDTFALDAVRCITSAESQKAYMLDAGNPAARGAVYDDPDVIKLFPMAALIRSSIDAAGPRPITPYYSDVSTSVQREWYPPSSVNPDRTPAKTAALIPKVLKDKVLL
ncbi:MAG: trehalose/maltose transport system substrate-binding protein [Frankiales bacterium]|nr:trehalose/maltose transport system substrate-binding protein [Frankiales bacterium]